MNIGYNVSTQPKFRAKTTINNVDKLLSQEEVKTLTKMGEKIGFNSDTINFSLHKADNNVRIAHEAKFNTNGNMLKINNIKEHSINSNHFEYIKARIKYFKDLYNQTSSFGL